jgi:two-component system response regulator
VNIDAMRAHVLVIDDNPGDIQLIELGFETNAVPVRIDRAGDGVQAQEVLRALHDAGDCPQLILLDLNMPRCNGFDVLRFMRAQGICPRSKVMVMTTSNAAFDRDQCTALGAGFITKPSRFTDLLDILKGFEPYLARQA